MRNKNTKENTVSIKIIKDRRDKYKNIQVCSDDTIADDLVAMVALFESLKARLAKKPVANLLPAF